MALTLSKVFRGVITVDFRNASTSILSYTGLKPDEVKLNITREKDVLEIEDGQKINTRKGLVGTLEMSLSQLNQADMETLETHAPGKADDIDNVKITFTSLGNGTNTYITVTGLADYDNSIETGLSWKLKHVFGITAAADVELSDIVVITVPA